MSEYKKIVVPHNEFYIVKFIRNENAPYLIFIHGGPGYNCGTIKYLIEHHELFDTLNYNLVLYDQRKCGRSLNFPEHVTHADNVDDLDRITNFLIQNEKLNIKAFVGHSYGAKLLYDYYKKFNSTAPGVFISTANSIMTPRINNLILDLAYLKKTNPIKYQEVLQSINDLNSKKIWEISEKLAPLFQENQDRHYLYWANLSWYEKIQRIQKTINLPTNMKVFSDVRKDLYSNDANYSVDINTLTIPRLWINGFQDYIMNGAESMLSKHSHITTFFQSSHYPHIEENKRFCEIVNEFVEQN